MENNYLKELSDLEDIYSRLLEDCTNLIHEKIPGIVKVMEEFIAHHKSQAALRSRLAILQSKLKTEEGLDDYDDE